MDKKEIFEALSEIKNTDAKQILLDVVKSCPEETVEVLFSKYFESKVTFVGLKKRGGRPKKVEPETEAEEKPEPKPIPKPVKKQNIAVVEEPEEDEAEEGNEEVSDAKDILSELSDEQLYDMLQEMKKNEEDE